MYEDITKWGSMIQESVDKEAEYKKQVEAYEAEKAVMDSAEDIVLDEAEEVIDWQPEREYHGMTPADAIKKEIEIVSKEFPKVKLEIKDIANQNGGISTIKVSGDAFDVDKFLDAYEIGFSDEILAAWDKIDESLKESIQNVDRMTLDDKMTLGLETPGGFIDITLEGDEDTNEWLIGILADALNKNPQKSSINFYQKKVNEEELNEWNDTHIPRGRVGHHETDIPKKFWVAIGDDQLINNYSEFVNQSLQLKSLANNATPNFTTQDSKKAKELAYRAVAKFPGKYVFIGVDDTSRGMMTGKNHLRASIRYYYDPIIKAWNDNDMYMKEDDSEA